MANLITLGRFLLFFLLVVAAYHAAPLWQLADAPLLLLIIALDGVDGYVARKRNETSVFGSIFDIAIDRVVENVLWVVLADLGMVPIWVAIVFITRSSIVDSIRYAAISRGETAFGSIRTQLGRALVSSRFMRGLYGALKAATFGWLFLVQPLPALVPEVWQRQAHWVGVVTDLLVYSSVLVCLLRALPVILEFLAEARPFSRTKPAGVL